MELPGGGVRQTSKVHAWAEWGFWLKNLVTQQENLLRQSTPLIPWEAEGVDLQAQAQRSMTSGSDRAPQ